jgi:preprotein translocase subunit SecG
VGVTGIGKMIWETVLVGVHVLVAAALVGLVLLQHGKGADMGAAFGSGSSGSLFGAAGSANFLSRTTAVLATVFFLSSLGRTYFGATSSGPTDILKQGVTETAPAPAAKETKAADVPQSAAPTTQAAPPKETDSKPSDIPK